eukprot:scaffold2114_cov142-Skeletonema_dohrnii-CCMP3373.AAC.1
MITSKEAALPLPFLALIYDADADANNVQLNSFAENSCTEFKRATAWFNGLRYYISKEDDSKDPCCVACPGWPAEPLIHGQTNDFTSKFYPSRRGGEGLEGQNGFSMIKISGVRGSVELKRMA